LDKVLLDNRYIYCIKDLLVQTLLLSIFTTLTLICILSYNYNNSSFAFHTPGSGYTIINKTLYANNGSDIIFTPQFPHTVNKSSNNTNNTKIPIPLSQQQQQQQLQNQQQQPVNKSGLNTNNTKIPVPLSQQQQQQQLQNYQQQLFLNRAQNINTTTIAMDVAKHIDLARQALQFGNGKMLLQQLNLAEMKLSLLVQKK